MRNLISLGAGGLLLVLAGCSNAEKLEQLTEELEECEEEVEELEDMEGQASARSPNRRLAPPPLAVPPPAPAMDAEALRERMLEELAAGGDPYGKTWTPHPEMPTIDESGAITTESGLTIISITDGEGDSPTPGQAVSMHYHGWLAADGSAFDSSSKRGQTLDFNVGTGRVIRGWDEGILALKPGQKARLRIPSNLGYGARGAPPVIPPGADLIFDVWLVSVD